LKRFLPVLLIGVFALSLLLTLAACSGGSGEFTYTAQTQEMSFRDDLVSHGIYTAPAPGGYYVLSKFRKEEQSGSIYGNQISFIDDAGERRSKVIDSNDEIYEGFGNYSLAYHGIWYKDGKIYTAYTVAPLNESELIDIVFETYDENFNLIKSVMPGSIPRWSYTNVVFDGEYFYYSSDDSRTGQDVPYPNSDAIVYRLNTEFEVIDSVNPTDKPTEPAGILRLFMDGDGKVYTVFFEEYFFGTRYKMKPYGENEKSVIIKGDLLNAEIATQGDSNFVTYYYSDSEESSARGYFGVKPNGDTVRINIESDEFINEFYKPTALLYSIVEDGTRVSFCYEDGSSGDDEERDIQKIVLTPAN
jgi:hypothetical protein